MPRRLVRLPLIAQMYLATEALVMLGALTALAFLGEFRAILVGLASVGLGWIILRQARVVLQNLQEGDAEPRAMGFAEDGDDILDASFFLPLVFFGLALVTPGITVSLITPTGPSPATIALLIWAYGAATQPWLPLPPEPGGADRWRWWSALLVKLGAAATLVMLGAGDAGPWLGNAPLTVGALAAAVIQWLAPRAGDEEAA